MPVVVDPPELDVVGDVAPQQVAADRAPGRPLRPGRARVEALDGGVADLVPLETGVERHHVGEDVARVGQQAAEPDAERTQ